VCDACSCMKISFAPSKSVAMLWSCLCVCVQGCGVSLFVTCALVCVNDDDGGMVLLAAASNTIGFGVHASPFMRNLCRRQP
jgi:hypothetical protein